MRASPMLFASGDRPQPDPARSTAVFETIGRFARRRSLGRFVLLVAVLALDVQPAPVTQGVPDTGMNLALNRPYVLDPAPNYPLTTDPGDTTQLTDGIWSSDNRSFWSQLSTVGWQEVRPITITIDLGSERSIGGAAFSTAAGRAGVLWPVAIYVLVSDDGRTFQFVGDLVVDSASPPADGYHTFRYTTDKWRTHGRYVRFVVDGGGYFLFADELEIYAGGVEPAGSRAMAGPPITNTMEFVRDVRTQGGIRKRLVADARAARVHLDATALPPGVSATLRTELDLIDRAIDALNPAPVETFKTILPLNDVHTRIYAAEGRLAEASGAAPLSVSAANPWAFLSPVAAVTGGRIAPGAISVSAMRGETRATAFDIGNASGHPADVAIRIDGLPGGGNPAYVAVHKVVWTDTRDHIPVADALQPLAPDGNSYRITIPAGITQQLWLSVKPGAEMPAGRHQGQIVVSRASQAGETTLPFALRVFDESFPATATLHVGGFDYLNRDNTAGVTPANAAALLATLREHFVDSPWATGSAVPFGAFNDTGQMVTPPATAEFDRWISRWPGVSRYYIFIAATDKIGTIPVGPAFDRAVGAWATFWAEHASTLGVRPEQLFLLIVDEPHARAQDERIIRWIKAIKAAVPQVTIWENPTYTNPAEGTADLFRLSDVLTPNREAVLKQGRSFTDFYRAQQTAGRALEVYSSKGPARLLDPYSYYRLQAWTCFALGAGASHFWAFGDSRGSSSWNEYALNGDAFTPLFIDRDSVTSSKHMAAIREGVEDFEYLVRLRERIRVVELNNPRHPALARAVSTLRTATQRVLDADGAGDSLWNSPKDRAIADAVRIEAGEALESLR